MIANSAQPETIGAAALMALGRGTNGWKFLNAVFPNLAPHNSQPGLMLLAASHLAKLGLRTFGLDLLRTLPPDMQQMPQVSALVQAVSSLPDDRATEADAWLTANLRALGDRATGVDQIQHLPNARVFLATDGNAITHRDGRWRNVYDSRGHSLRSIAELRSTWNQAAQSTLFIAGCRSPWLLKGASEARVREKLGYRAPIYIVEPDREAFMTAMSMTDLSLQLSDGHIRAFVGENALEAFRGFLHSRLDLRISGQIAQDPEASSSLVSAVGSAVEEELSQQQLQTRRIEQEVRAQYRPRDASWWSERFANSDRPLRVLIPTSRYSTFVQHSSSDVASAFRALGHEAQILIEPDDSSFLAAGAYLRAIRDFEPDLVLCINFPRESLGDFVPRNLPWVCWIQDQMPHLFNERIGRSQGAFDFTVGHVVTELHERYGYPRESSMLLPVPASETKFHASPATESERAKFECEVAYVSHQSETPEAQHERIVHELRASPAVDASLIAAMGPLREAIKRHLALPLSTLPFPNMHSVVRASLRESLGMEPQSQITDLLVTGYAYPLADRMMRHETLAWAGAIAKRRGWRFHLYGNAWETHPTLGEFAKGPLAHDGDLRLSYQCAGCHLQVTYHTLGHPRLCECVLSGGIPLCRLHWGERSMIETSLFKLGWHQGAQFRDQRVGEDVRRSPWTDAPALMKFASVFQSMGCFEDAVAPDDAGHCDGYSPGALQHARWGAPFHPRLVSDRSKPAPLIYPFAFEMVGEQPEFFFHNERVLEERLDALIESRTSRVARNAAARARVERSHTYSPAVRSILELVRSRLSIATSSEHAAA